MIYKIKNSLEKYKQRNAFYINNKYFTYYDFTQKITGIIKLIKSDFNQTQQNIGIITYNDIETYSSIFALWFTNNCFIPINPNNPLNRNLEIINSAEIKYILTSNSKDISYYKDQNVNILNTSELLCGEVKLNLPEIDDDDKMYILFTSGSTGIPKGVPINRKNFNSFFDAFSSIGFNVNENDKFLQMFDYSFDVSVQCYVFSLLTGSCIYTVPQDNMKFLNAIDLIKKHEITFAVMVPSTLSLLQKYFSEIHLEKLKYLILTGESIYSELVKKWSGCIPNTTIFNFYGPTEGTIYCLYYTCNKDFEQNISYNGIISIGKPLKDIIAIVVDSNLKQVPIGTKGELCIAGNQLTNGYLNNPEKNKESFFNFKINNENRIFYHTGDLVFIDKTGNYFYCGRLDNQIKIQGNRVELSEIEHFANKYTKNNTIALAVNNSQNFIQIHLFIENFKGNTEDIFNYLSEKIPKYMLPATINTIPIFPRNISGKIDRNKLSKQIKIN